MKKTDRVLLGIVGGVILLVVAAFVVALNKQKPTYQVEDQPEGVAFNYLFALQQDDYQRAYGYLDPSLNGYPQDLEEFNDDIREHSWVFRGLDEASTSLEVTSVVLNGKSADVEMRETRFYEGDLFSSGQYSNIFTLTLRSDDHGNWKIVDGEDYWLFCWEDFGGCR